MEAENKSQFAKMALIGGAVILGAIAVIKLLGGDEDESDKVIEQVQTDFTNKIKALGLLKKNERGIIDYEQFKSLFKLCAQTSKDMGYSEKQEAIAERRKAYKAEDWDKYGEIALKATQQEEILFTNCLQQASDEMGISEQDMQMAQAMYMQNPQCLQDLQQIQQTPASLIEVKMTREQTIKEFMLFEKQRMDIMIQMMS